MTLIEWLILKQNELGNVDAQFARLLGLHATSWMRFRTGQLRPTLRLMRAAMNRWPESEIEICRAARIEEPTAA